MAASESGGSALPGPVPSFKIGQRVWKLGDPIHSIGTAAVEKKKMVETFGDQYATARVEGVFMGHGSGKKYCVKWTNLREDLECEYGAGHNLFKDPAAVRPQKQPKIHNQPAVVPSPDRSSGAGLNDTDGGELYLSDPEVSEPDVEDPQIPGISPLLVGGNQWRHDAACDALDPRIGGPVCVRDTQIRFPTYLRAGETPSEVTCVRLFMHLDMIPHLVMHTNLRISEEKSKVTEREMERWIGIMFAMTISPIPNIQEYWRQDDDGIILANRFGEKLHMSKNRFEFIRQNFTTGAAPDGAKTFDAIRPIQTFFNERAQAVVRPSHKIVVDESTCGWHGKDDKRADGPPALTHMKGKPEPVSFMI
jgi:hypothetical protein